MLLLVIGCEEETSPIGEYDGYDEIKDLIVTEDECFLYNDEYQYETSNRQYFTITIYNPEDDYNINEDICYDIIFIPDLENGSNYARQHYFYDYNDRIIKNNTYTGLRGRNEIKFVRASQNDRLVVEFYDGSMEEVDLGCYNERQEVFKKSNKSIIKYDCYFDGKLIEESKTYEELKEFVCDNYVPKCIKK